MKICNKCNINKPYIDFNKMKSAKDGYNHQCKLCWKEYQQQYYCKNIEKLKQNKKQHYIKNIESYKQFAKQYYIDNADKLRQCAKQHYIDNVESYKQYSKQYYKNNLEYFKQYHKQYYLDNAEHLQQYIEQWRQSEQGKLSIKVKNHKRRSLINANTPIGKHFTPADIILKLKLQNYKCVYCENSIKDYFEPDHFIPLIKGGSNEPSNIQLLCQECNRGKGGKHDKLPHEFAKKFNMLF